MQRIYKYVAPERIDILTNLKIRFTQHSQLNDPFDLTIPTKTFIDKGSFEKFFNKETIFGKIKSVPYLDYLLGQSGYTSDQFFDMFLEQIRMLFTEENDMVKEFFKAQIDKEFGVLSLTEKPDNPQMWAHYANNHKGFVIIFNAEDKFFHHGLIDDNDFGEIKKVSYQKEPIILESLLDLKSVGSQMLYSKEKNWEYEYEWRMLNLLKNATTVIDQNIFLFDLPANAIHGIILGEKSSSEFKSNVRNLLKSASTLKHLELYQAKANTTNHSIDYFLIN